MNNKNNLKNEKIRKIHKDKESVEFGSIEDVTLNPNLMAYNLMYKQKEKELDAANKDNKKI